jgi:hypothetical protein
MRIDSRYPGAQVDIDRRVEIYRRRFLFVIPMRNLPHRNPKISSCMQMELQIDGERRRKIAVTQSSQAEMFGFSSLLLLHLRLAPAPYSESRTRAF